MHSFVLDLELPGPWTFLQLEADKNHQTDIFYLSWRIAQHEVGICTAILFMGRSGFPLNS